YSPDATGIPGWSYYAGVFFHPKNPWWPHLHRLASYVQRVSFLLRQRVPVADVALYLPEDDVMARAAVGQPLANQKVSVKPALSEGKEVPQFGLADALRNRSRIVST